MTSHHNVAPKVKVTILEIDQDKITFRLENADTAFANALRRVMIAEVPTMAIDLVEIDRNTTCLDDEFISHRLGLIPIASERVAELKYSRDCECDDWCDSCSVLMEIDITQTTEATRSITTKDIHIQGAHPHFQPVDSVRRGRSTAYGQQEPITIVKVNHGQELKLRAIAKKGVGKMHAKWSPVATAVYHFVPEIRLHREVEVAFDHNDRKVIVDSCPAQIFRYNEQEDCIDIEEANLHRCTFCMECVEKARELRADGLVLVREKRGEEGTFNFLFTVESTGVLKPQTIVLSALEVLHAKVEKVRDALSGLVL